MSPATSVVSGSIRRSADLSSSGTTIPTQAFPCQILRRDHKDGPTTRQVSQLTRQVSQSRSVLVEILRTNDLVLITVIESILKAERVAYFVADQHMAAVEGSLGFLPRRILVDGRSRKGARGVSLSKRASEKNCAMAEPSSEPGARRGGGRADRGRVARRPAHARPAEARPSGRHGRRPARRGGGRRWPRPDRRRRRGVGAVGLALAKRWALAFRRSRRDRSRAGGARRAATRRATGFRRARGSCGSTRSTQ